MTHAAKTHAAMTHAAMTHAVMTHAAQELDPEVVSHMHQLGIPIAAIAMPWITTAFVGHLPVEEVRDHRAAGSNRTACL